MKFSVYIIQSQSNGRYYCGFSSDIARRLLQHNDPNYRLSRTTKVIEGPWEVVWTQECSSQGQAMRLEKKIKNRGIERYLAEFQ